MAGIFLRIDGVEGGSLDKAHKNEIEVLDWNWGMRMPEAAGGGRGAGTAGRVDIDGIQVTKTVDVASPRLVQACCMGRHFSEASLVVEANGEKARPIVTLRVIDVVVASVALEGASAGRHPIERVTLRFGAFELDFTPRNPDGSTGGAVKASWDLHRNAPRPDAPLRLRPR
jgi:type VI secretion system secreted protein Hcp